MSYTADHMFWQQRVMKELGATSRFSPPKFTTYRKIWDLNPSMTPTGINSRMLLTSSNYGTGLTSPTSSGSADKAAYTFGGTTNIKKSKTMKDLVDGKDPRESAQLNEDYLVQTLPDEEASEYPRYKTRSAAHSRSGSKMRKNDKRVLAIHSKNPPELQTERVQRFNEDLEDNPHFKKTDKLKSSASSVSNFTIDSVRNSVQKLKVVRPASRGSNASRSLYKEKILDAITKLNDDDIDKLRKTLHIEDAKPTDVKNKKSDDRLNRNAWTNGYPNPEEEQQHSDVLIKKFSSNSCRSSVSRPTTARSAITNQSFKTSTTYVSMLEQKLDEERKARERLESEVEELKKLSTKLSSALSVLEGKK